MTRWGNWASLGPGLIMVILAAATLSGCSGGAAPTCLPARLTITPTTPTRGDTVTVASPRAECALGYDPHHAYLITLNSGMIHSPSVIEPVKTDGAFSARITIPLDFPVGRATISVSGSPFDNCKDTNSGASCAGYSTMIDIH